MTNLKNLKISTHFINDRQGRKETIDRIICGNWGQVMKEEYIKGAYRCLTDTGLMFILNDSKTIIITYYFATCQHVQEMYRYQAPKNILKKIRDNQRKFKAIYGCEFIEIK